MSQNFTAILVSKRLVPFTEKHGVITPSRIQYITYRISKTLYRDIKYVWV